MFINGPVQNGEFNFEEKPGKATGIRIAEALNEQLGIDRAPHLWNSVMLANDIRHRELLQSEGSGPTREEFEYDTILDKYHNSDVEPPETIITDADSIVSEYALKIIEAALSRGQMKIRQETVNICSGCGHMTCHYSQCMACGTDNPTRERQEHLVVDRDGCGDAVDCTDMYGRVNTRPFRAAIKNHPNTLILSKTRAYGIELGAIGLKKLVLDPRAGLHTTALAVAESTGASEVRMAVTANAALNIMAYGRQILRLAETDFKYAVHGMVPYSELEDENNNRASWMLSPSEEDLFKTWFLPMYSLTQKSNINDSHIESLAKHFKRALLISYGGVEGETEDQKEQLKEMIRIGDLSWLTNKYYLAQALQVASTGEKISS